MKTKQIALILSSIACLATNTTPRQANHTTFLKNLPTLECLCDKIAANPEIYSGSDFETACGVLNKYTIEDMVLSSVYDSYTQQKRKFAGYPQSLKALSLLTSEEKNTLVMEQIIEMEKKVQTAVNAIIADEIDRLEKMKTEWNQAKK